MMASQGKASHSVEDVRRGELEVNGGAVGVIDDRGEEGVHG